MASKIGWELYRSFLAVLEEGSLSGAARALGIAQPTVGRHVSSLQKALGVALFTRTPTGLLPTDAALNLRPHAETMEATVAAMERAAASHGEGVRGVVRVTASEVIGVEVLPAIVARLQSDHPELIVELVLSNRVQDLLRREADIAVRMTRPRQDMLVARRIGNVELGLHATRTYLQQHGTPRRTEELAKHRLIGFDQSNAFIRAASKALPFYQREAFSIRSDNDLAHLALIRAGAGIGVCQVALAKRSADIVRVLPKQVSIALDTWITMHESLRGSPGCRATFDTLVKGLQAHCRQA